MFSAIVITFQKWAPCPSGWLWKSMKQICELCRKLHQPGSQICVAFSMLSAHKMHNPLEYFGALCNFLFSRLVCSSFVMMQNSVQGNFFLSIFYSYKVIHLNINNGTNHILLWALQSSVRPSLLQDCEYVHSKSAISIMHSGIIHANSEMTKINLSAWNMIPVKRMNEFLQRAVLWV